MSATTLSNYIAGIWQNGKGGKTLPVENPSTGEVIAYVPLSGAHDVDAAVSAADKALSGWSSTPIKERVQIFFRYRTLLENILRNWPNSFIKKMEKFSVKQWQRLKKVLS